MPFIFDKRHSTFDTQKFKTLILNGLAFLHVKD